MSNLIKDFRYDQKSSFYFKWGIGVKWLVNFEYYWEQLMRTWLRSLTQVRSLLSSKQIMKDVFCSRKIYFKLAGMTRVGKFWLFVCQLYYELFFYLDFLSRTFTILRAAREGEAISLTPFYHFQSLHRHLDINQTITSGGLLLHKIRSQNQTGNLRFPSASH